jgi:hypothetical protein
MFLCFIRVSFLEEQGPFWLPTFTFICDLSDFNGELIGGLPDFKARNQSVSQDSRQFQLGWKFIF